MIFSMFKNFIFKLIKLYQLFISPFFGKNCRFYPSCSNYTFLAIEKNGIVRGGWKGFKRILKCHPWHLGGVDLP